MALQRCQVFVLLSDTLANAGDKSHQLSLTHHRTIASQALHDLDVSHHAAHRSLYLDDPVEVHGIDDLFKASDDTLQLLFQVLILFLPCSRLLLSHACACV